MKNTTRNMLLVFGLLVFGTIIVIANNYFDDLPNSVINNYRNINY